MVQEDSMGTSNPESRAETLSKLHELLNSKSQPEATSSPGQVARYSLFREQLKPKSDIVYYPCSSVDTSPSLAFPDSRVIYVDIEDSSMGALRRRGYEAKTASVLEFNPGDVDILIMLNPTIPPKVPSSHVAEGGFVLCNDYHGTASLLHEDDNYRPSAVIRISREGKLIFDTENLDNCFKEVTTDEEFKNAPFSFGRTDYDTARDVVEAITGKRENILVEYKKLLEGLREKERQEYAEATLKDPEQVRYMSDPDKTDIFMFDYAGRRFILSSNLPRKKGAADDMFIFQKHTRVPQNEDINH